MKERQCLSIFSHPRGSDERTAAHSHQFMEAGTLFCLLCLQLVVLYLQLLMLNTQLLVVAVGWKGIIVILEFPVIIIITQICNKFRSHKFCDKTSNIKRTRIQGLTEVSCFPLVSLLY